MTPFVSQYSGFSHTHLFSLCIVPVFLYRIPSRSLRRCCWVTPIACYRWWWQWLLSGVPLAKHPELQGPALQAEWGGHCWPPRPPRCGMRSVSAVCSSRTVGFSPPQPKPWRIYHPCPMTLLFLALGSTSLQLCPAWGTLEEVCCSCFWIVRLGNCTTRHFQISGGHLLRTESHRQPTCKSCPHMVHLPAVPFCCKCNT